MIQKIQVYIAERIPGIPDDAVWGAVKSSAYSFTVSIISTKGNYMASAQSAALAALATAIYALVVAFVKKIFSGEKSDPANIQVIFFIASTLTYVVTELLGTKVSILISVFFTGIPYAIKYSPKKTPLFGIITSQVYDIILSNRASVLTAIPTQLRRMASVSST